MGQRTQGTIAIQIDIYMDSDSGRDKHTGVMEQGAWMQQHVVQLLRQMVHREVYDGLRDVEAVPSASDEAPVPQDIWIGEVRYMGPVEAAPGPLPHLTSRVQDLPEWAS